MIAEKSMHGNYACNETFTKKLQRSNNILARN